MAKKAYKTELAPTKVQIEFFEVCCEARRLTYNWVLAHHQVESKRVLTFVDNALGRFASDPTAMDVLLRYTFVGYPQPPNKARRAVQKIRGQRTREEIREDRAWCEFADRDPDVIKVRKEAITKLAAAWAIYLVDVAAWKAIAPAERKKIARPKRPTMKLRLFQLPMGDSPTLFLKSCWRKVYRKDTELSWMWCVPSAVIDCACMDLDAAYSKRIAYLKLPMAERLSRPEVGEPKFKKHQNNSSFSVISSPGGILVEHRRIKLTNIGVVKVKEKKHYLPEGRTTSKVTVSSAGGKWFVSVLGTFEPEALSGERPHVGIDVGIVHYAILQPDSSPVERVENPRHLVHGLKRLKMLQRFGSRKMGPKVVSVTMPDGSAKIFPTNHVQVRRAREEDRKVAKRNQTPSNRWKKNVVKVNRCHYRIACRRRNFQHELTTGLIKRFAAISIETLGIQDMVRRHGKKSTNKMLRMLIGDASWYEFRRLLTYKGQWHGTTVEAVSRWYPSTQQCSVCGATTDVNWHDRKCRCQKCGLVIDMDDNASKNLLSEMIRNACGLSSGSAAD